jgi:hypothetical protein
MEAFSAAKRTFASCLTCSGLRKKTPRLAGEIHYGRIPEGTE